MAASDSAKPMLDEARRALASGEIARALECLRAIAVDHPHDAIALHDAGVLLASAQRPADAIEFFRQSLAINPNFARAQFNLGLASRLLGDTDEAADAFRRAMQIAPDAIEPCAELADLLAELGRHEDALALLDGVADRFAPNDRFHATRGYLLKRAARLPEAAESLRRAVALSERSISHRCNLALIFNEMGHADDADAMLAPVLASNPPASVRLRSAIMLPAIAESLDQIHRTRARLEQTLDELLLAPDRFADPMAALNSIPFYLAYAGQDDRPILEKLAAVHRHICPSLNFGAEHFRHPAPPRDRKIRLGIVSSNLYAHTIGLLNIGLIERIDRSRFELFVLENGINDAVANRVRAAADQTIRAPRALAALRQSIAACELDVLFYPDIGMVPLTYYLAFARLAPVQCVTWGHPLTTGLKSIDYFISAQALETATSQSQYVESLHRLSVPGTCYERPKFQPLADARSHFGFDRSWRLYVCPQSLFKIHPEFDAVLARILRDDPAGRIVLVAGNSGAMFPALRKRLERSMAGDVDRLILLPRVTVNEFLSLLSIADANLDTLHFGGGNTSLEAFAVGCPTVTMPSQFLRGRITQALYRQMELADCIASTTDEYVRIALRLANDRDWHAQESSEILARNHVLFDNQNVVREMEDFFTAALKSRAPAS
ncbi:tetratricopeptide repeat protein [soil metagenome]